MIEVPVSIGELVDKITILKIKNEKILDKTKLKNIDNEMSHLIEKLNSLNLEEKIENIFQNLYEVNSELWDVEDRLREFEKRKYFGIEFINDARKVYELNDLRFSLKKKINLMTDSKFVEEKSYTNV
jgi:hypothetical protein